MPVTQKFYIKRDDTKPDLEATLTDGAGAAVDITGATVTFNFNPPGTGASSNSSATIVTAASGEVSYTFTAAQTAQSGVGTGEFVVDFGGGAVQSFPTEGFIEIHIQKDIEV